VFGQKPADKRQPLADQGDRKRRGYNCPGGGAGRRENPLGMNASSEQAIQKAMNGVERILILVANSVARSGRQLQCGEA
jgi:hypothetical protein